jgi:hypothetical protein
VQQQQQEQFEQQTTSTTGSSGSSRTRALQPGMSSQGAMGTGAESTIRAREPMQANHQLQVQEQGLQQHYCEERSHEQTPPDPVNQDQAGYFFGRPSWS